MATKDLEDSGAGRQALGGVVTPNSARGKRVVVSVSLAREEFDRIAAAAGARGVRMSEFIKISCLEAAPAAGASAEIVGTTGNPGAVFFLQVGARTVFGQTHLDSAPEVVQEPPLATATA